MNLKKPAYEAYLEEAIPRELNFAANGLRVALFGFREDTDRFAQIEEALDHHFPTRTTSEVRRMQKDAMFKDLKKAIKQRSMPRGMSAVSPNGVLMIPLERKFPEFSEPKRLF